MVRSGTIRRAHDKHKGERYVSPHTVTKTETPERYIEAERSRRMGRGVDRARRELKDLEREEKELSEKFKTEKKSRFERIDTVQTPPSHEQLEDMKRISEIQHRTTTIKEKLKLTPRDQSNREAEIREQAKKNYKQAVRDKRFVGTEEEKAQLRREADEKAQSSSRLTATQRARLERIEKGEGYKHDHKGETARDLQALSERQRRALLKRDAEKVIGAVKAVGSAVKENVLKPASRLANEIKDEMMEDMRPDYKYIETGGLESKPEYKGKLSKAQRIRVNHDADDEIEVLLPDGTWRGTGKRAEYDVPQQFTNAGVSYRTLNDTSKTPQVIVVPSSLTDSEPDVVSLPRNQEDLFGKHRIDENLFGKHRIDENLFGKQQMSENPLAGNLFGQMNAAEASEYIRRQQAAQPRSRSNAWDSGIYTTQRKKYAEPSTPSYMTPQTARLLHQPQSTEPRNAPRTGFTQQVGRNPLVDQEAMIKRAIAADRAQRGQQVQPQQPESFGGSAVSFLFGGRKSSAYGGSRAFTQPSAGSDSLFSGNRSLLGSTVAPRTVQQQPQISSSEGLFSGNLRNISATASLFGGQRSTGSSNLSVIGSGLMNSVFPVHYGGSKKQQSTAEVSSPSVKTLGDKKMTEGTFELYRSTKQGIVKVALTPSEYQVLSARNPAGYTGFYRVNGKRAPYKAYLSAADIQALQASGRMALVPKGPRRRK